MECLRRDYAALPTDAHPPRGWSLKRRRCRIRVLFCLACTPLLALLALLSQGIPPAYNDVRAFERRLPQHAVADLTRTDGRPARFLRFPGHLWGHGLNNILQEALLMSYLAYVSNVSFVFEDYVWSHVPLPWTLYGIALRPTRLPINAIISGPTAGAPIPDAPHAVSAEFYVHVCPTPDAVISSADAPNDADGDEIIAWWQAHIAPLDARCIEIDSAPHDLFDRFLFGGPRVLALFDALVASPILANFTWSPLVHAALVRNFALLQPSSAMDLLSSVAPATATVTALDGLVALHLRRGDYVRHCPNLAKWGADYMGFNQHPSLRDRFDSHTFTDPVAREAYYRVHCYPTTDQLVERLSAIRAQHPGVLRRVYILSNDSRWSLRDVRRALEADGWSDVRSTLDLTLDAEQYYVSMAVDMAIAERAEVFVGNGFSSLSSNIVLLRLAKGMGPATIRFL